MTDLSPDRLRDLYVTQGLTVREVAAELGVSHGQAQQALAETDWYRPRLDVVLDRLDPEQLAADDGETEVLPDGGTRVATGSLRTRESDPEWRLRWFVGDLEHRTAWCSDFAVVENLYDQYLRDDHFTDLSIERREVVRA